MIWYVLAFSQENEIVYVDSYHINIQEVQIWNFFVWYNVVTFLRSTLPLFVLWVWCKWYLSFIAHVCSISSDDKKLWILQRLLFIQWSDCFTINRFDPQVYEGIKFFTMFFTNDSSCVRKNNNVRRMTAFKWRLPVFSFLRQNTYLKIN